MMFPSSKIAMIWSLFIFLYIGLSLGFQPDSGRSSYFTRLRPLRMGFFSTNPPSSASKAASVPYKIVVDRKEIIINNQNGNNNNSNLRKLLMNNNIDVYPLKAKVTGNCGGAGICGTCAVKVISGKENLSPPSKNEMNTLQGKPADWRLSCCSKLSGPIEIKTKP